MKKQLFDYQEKLYREAALAIQSGCQKLLIQSATGSGKTVLFSYIANGYIGKSTKDVIIYVHRKELAKQTRDTIFQIFGISSQLITAGMKRVPKARIYVAMIESAKKRLPSNIGLAIIDECHIASLHKAHLFSDGIPIIGFSATPISANKKVPLNSIYEKIIVGPQIGELIAKGRLVQNITIAPSDVVDRAKLKVKGAEFNEQLMGDEFSKAKHVKSTLVYYEKFLKGKKTLIYNCNIAHSIEVTRYFKAHGYNIRHLDSENCSDAERDATLDWLKNTEDAILSSVGILTAGFDEPSVIGIMVNRSIMSPALWLQICGRGGRTYLGKQHFYIIDMGGNAVNLGDWCDDRDWEDIFLNPDKPKDKAGVAPCKSCTECEAIIPAQARACKYCGHEFPVKAVADEVIVSENYTILTKGINIESIIESANRKNYKQYASFYEIGKRIIKNATKKQLTNRFELTEIYTHEAQKWCELQNKKFNFFHKKLISEFFDAEFSKLQAPETEHKIQIKPIQNLTSLPSWL